MPVIQKNSLGQTNGELSEEPIKESQPGKVKQEETALPQQPAGQVWQHMWKQTFLEYLLTIVIFFYFDE